MTSLKGVGPRKPPCSQATWRNRIAITFLGASLAVSFACNSVDHKREDELVAQIDSLRAFFRATRSAREEIDGRSRPVLVSQFELEALRKRGLSSPLIDLANDLRTHPNLIPSPVNWMGPVGFMGVYLLTSKWVLAEFGDGHLGGHMILEFEVREPGVVIWKPIIWSMG